MSLEIEERESGGVLVLDLSGRLTAGAGAERLRESVREIAARGRTKVLLNMGDVAFVDSAGLGALAVAAQALEGRGGVLRIANARPPVRKVMQVTGLDKVFPEFKNEAAALASFRS